MPPIMPKKPEAALQELEQEKEKKSRTQQRPDAARELPAKPPAPELNPAPQRAFPQMEDVHRCALARTPAAVGIASVQQHF